MLGMGKGCSSLFKVITHRQIPTQHVFSTIWFATQENKQGFNKKKKKGDNACRLTLLTVTDGDFHVRFENSTLRESLTVPRLLNCI